MDRRARADPQGSDGDGAEARAEAAGGLRPPPPRRRHRSLQAAPREKPHASQVLKGFFLAMGIGLIGSTVLGILMAFGYKRDRRVVLGLLAAGIVIPAVALFM